MKRREAEQSKRKKRQKEKFRRKRKLEPSEGRGRGERAGLSSGVGGWLGGSWALFGGRRLVKGLNWRRAALVKGP